MSDNRPVSTLPSGQVTSSRVPIVLSAGYDGFLRAWDTESGLSPSPSIFHLLPQASSCAHSVVTKRRCSLSL
jgi:hypothetical protein